MTRALLAVAVTALATFAAPSASAAAGPGDPVDYCSYSSTTNPFATGRQVGYLGGGTVPFADGTDARTGRVTCTARNGYTHTDPTLVAVTSWTTPGVATVPYTLVEYAEPAEIYWLTACLSVEIDGGGTFYWDAAGEAWSTDPDVLCWDWNDDGFDFLYDLVDLAAGAVDDVFVEHVDPVFCAATGGDVVVPGDVLFWDCPPYGSR